MRQNRTRRTRRTRLDTLVQLAVFSILTAEASFAGILYGGGQPIENNVLGCLDSLGKFDRAVGNAKRRYSSAGVSQGIALAGALSAEVDALRQELRVLEGVSVFELRTTLEASIATSTAIDRLAGLRAELRACRSCDLEGGAADGIDRVGDDLEFRLAVLGELLPLGLLSDFSGEWPPTPVFETLPPITGATDGGGVPSLAGAVADLVGTYGELGHREGLQLARTLEGQVEDLANAIDAATFEVTVDHADRIRDALADVRETLAIVEATVARIADCCSVAPGLTAPVRTLVVHVRAQVGALLDAALDSVGIEHLFADPADPEDFAIVPEYILRQAIADTASAIQRAATVYRQLEDPRRFVIAGATLTDDLLDLAASVEALDRSPPQPSDVGDVTAVVERIERNLRDLTDCCNATAGLLLPVRHGVSRIRYALQRLLEVRVSAALHELGLSPENAAVPELLAAHWTWTVTELSRLADRAAARYDELGNGAGAALADSISETIEEIDIDSYSVAADDRIRGNTLADISAALIRIRETIHKADDCCALVPALARLRTSVEVMALQVEADLRTLLPVFLFLRGDVNSDGVHDLGDPVAILFRLFIGGGEALVCEKSADANDDGLVDVSDPIALLTFLFLDGAPLPEPFAACGEDRTEDELPCATQPECEGIIQP